MLTYHILYNPHAGSGRGQEAAYRLNVLLPDDRLLFRDITEIDDYGAFFRSLRDDDRVVIAGGDGTLNRFINDTAPPPIIRISVCSSRFLSPTSAVITTEGPDGIPVHFQG